MCVFSDPQWTYLKCFIRKYMTTPKITTAKITLSVTPASIPGSSLEDTASHTYKHVYKM